jgi:hypothetical protein
VRCIDNFFIQINSWSDGSVFFIKQQAFVKGIFWNKSFWCCLSNFDSLFLVINKGTSSKDCIESFFAIFSSHWSKLLSRLLLSLYFGHQFIPRQMLSAWKASSLTPTTIKFPLLKLV